MFVHVETSYVVKRIERNLAHRNAAELGPLLAEVGRKSTDPTANSEPFVRPLIRRLMQQLQAVQRDGPPASERRQDDGSLV